MEDFNLNLELDEATEARIAHADYLKSVLDWGYQHGASLHPLANLAKLIDDTPTEEFDLDAIKMMIPALVVNLIEEINTLYVSIQKEAKKVLGAPFAQPNGKHHDKCGEIDDICGHRSHFE